MLKMHDFNYLQKEEWSAETKSLVFYDEYNSDLGQGIPFFHLDILVSANNTYFSV